MDRENPQNPAGVPGKFWAVPKTPKTQEVIQDIASNARLIDGEGQNTSIDDKNLRLSQF